MGLAEDCVEQPTAEDDIGTITPPPDDEEDRFYFEVRGREGTGPQEAHKTIGAAESGWRKQRRQSEHAIGSVESKIGGQQVLVDELGGMISRAGTSAADVERRDWRPI